MQICNAAVGVGLFVVALEGALFAQGGTIALDDANDAQDVILLEGPVVFVRHPHKQVGGFGREPHRLAGVDTVEVDHAGNFYVYDPRQHCIKVWSLDRSGEDVIEVITSESIEESGLAGLGRVRGISAGRAFDPDEETRVLILDCDAERTPCCRILERRSRHDGRWRQLEHTRFFSRPHDLTVDRRGRIVIAERGGTIEVLEPDGAGRDLDFARNGVLKLGAVAGIRVSAFKAVDTDLAGNLYVSDKNNGRILKLSPKGDVLRVIGEQGAAKHQFAAQVEGVAVDWRGNVYGRDEKNERFLVFGPDGEFVGAFGERGLEPNQQEGADEFTIAKSRDTIIIADALNYRASAHSLRRASFHEEVVAAATDYPRGLVVLPIWIAGGKRGDAPGEEFDEPNELAFDREGRLWAGDVYNFRVQIFAQDGTFVAVVGGEGSAPGEFVRPGSGKFGAEAIRADSENSVYVVDRGGDKINVYDGGSFECVRMIRDPERFEDPTGLAIDSKDRLYVADQGTGSVHQYSRGGEYQRTFEHTRGGEIILKKTETLALDEARDRLFASSEDASRVEAFGLSSGTSLGLHVVEIQTSGRPMPGRVIDDVEGIATDTVNDWLLVSDEDNGRFLVHDLGRETLGDPGDDFAFIGAFGQLGSGPGEFLSADGVVAAPEIGLIAVADQGNFRIQVFRIDDVKKAFAGSAGVSTASRAE